MLELAAGRHFNIQPNRRPLPPSSEDEWQRLTAVSRQQVDDSYATHRRALARVGEFFRMSPVFYAVSFFVELEAVAELGARNIIAQLPDPDRERKIARFARTTPASHPRWISVMSGVAGSWRRVGAFCSDW